MKAKLLTQQYETIKDINIPFVKGEQFPDVIMVGKRFFVLNDVTEKDELTYNEIYMYVAEELGKNLTNVDIDKPNVQLDTDGKVVTPIKKQ